MSIKSLEERVSDLERQLAALQGVRPSPLQGPAPDDWKKTIGVFAGDKFMAEVFDEALKIREADRRKARRGQRKARRGE